jgi:hypothetical protein
LLDGSEEGKLEDPLSFFRALELSLFGALHLSFVRALYSIPLMVHLPWNSCNE